MKKGILVAAFLMAVSTLAVRPAAAQPASSPLFPSQMFSNITPPDRTFELVQFIIEYAPGAFSALNSSPSPRFVTVMSGEMSFTIGDRTAVYPAGTSLTIPSAILARGSNEGRTASARVFASILQPVWAQEGRGAVVVAGTEPPAANAPRAVSASVLRVENIPDVINLVQGGARLDPGFAFPLHVMNHPHGILHLEGVTSYEYVDGGSESFSAGLGGLMHPGRPGTMANRGATPSAYVMTWLQTPGTPLSSPFTPPAAPAPGVTPPRTGDAGLGAGPSATTSRAAFGLAAVGLVSVVILVSWRTGQVRRPGSRN
jgi:quercetin dioxygenase-like cupin family protein